MKYIYLLVGLLFFSCQQNYIKKNAPEDISKASVLAKNFYTKLQKNDTLYLIKQLDSTISPSDFTDLLKRNKMLYGDIINYKINELKTISKTTNENNNVEYIIGIDVIYEKSKNLEHLMFLKDENNNIFLMSYYVKDNLKK